MIPQFAKAVELGNFALRFGQAGGSGKRFGDGFAIQLACEAVVGTVAGITGTVAMTVWIPTKTASSGDGAGAHVTQQGDLVLNGGTAGFQVG